MPWMQSLWLVRSCWWVNIRAHSPPCWGQSLLSRPPATSSVVSSSPTACSGCSRAAILPSEQLRDRAHHRSHLSHREHPVYFVVEVDEFSSLSETRNSCRRDRHAAGTVSYTHLRAHETPE